LEGSQWQKEKMASEVPKPNESGTTTPASREPREIMIFVTNQRWECRLQEGTPYLDNGYQKFIKGDDNPHHWGYKRFQVYDAPGAGLIEVKAGDPPVQFWAHSKNDDKKLTLYWILKKRHGSENRTIWFVFAPNYMDERQVARGSDFWGWELVQRFYARSKVDNWVCESCTFLNTRVDDECEECRSPAPAERKSTPIKKPPTQVIPRQQVVVRSPSMDSENGSGYGSSLKWGWWTCFACGGENPPGTTRCDFCGRDREDWNPRVKGDNDPTKKPVVPLKGSSESFALVSSTRT